MISFGRNHIMGVVDIVDTVDTADIVHTVDTLDNVKSVNSVDNVSSVNSVHSVHNVQMAHPIMIFQTKMAKSTGVPRFGPKINGNENLGLGSGSHGLQELKKRVPGPKTVQKNPKNGSPWALLPA